jgi:hypothetical protein
LIYGFDYLFLADRPARQMRWEVRLVLDPLDVIGENSSPGQDLSLFHCPLKSGKIKVFRHNQLSIRPTRRAFNQKNAFSGHSLLLVPLHQSVRKLVIAEHNAGFVSITLAMRSPVVSRCFPTHNPECKASGAPDAGHTASR